MCHHADEQLFDFDGIVRLEQYYTPMASRLFTQEEEAFIATYVKHYLVPERPSAESVYNHMFLALRELNDERVELGIPPLRLPSRATFNRRIAALPKHRALLARHGMPR